MIVENSSSILCILKSNIRLNPLNNMYEYGESRSELELEKKSKGSNPDSRNSKKTTTTLHKIGGSRSFKNLKLS